MYTIEFKETGSDKSTKCVTELLEEVKTWNDKRKVHFFYQF